MVTEKYGGFYRYQTFLNDWREIAGLLKHQEYWQSFSPTRTPPISMMAKSASPFGKRFTYYFEKTVIDEETGELKKKGFRIGFDELVDWSTAKQEMLERYKHIKYEEIDDISGYYFAGIKHKDQAIWLDQ